MMTFDDVMTELQDVGTAQNCKIYGRHGVNDPMFGVSVANMKKLAKKIKTNHALAQQLWNSGNHDARVLATKIADPEHITAAELDSWVQDLGNYVISDAFSEFVQRTPFLHNKMRQWIPSDNEWVSATGWNLLGYIALSDADVPLDFFDSYLTTIERDIHTRKNRVRYAMNNALIHIGSRHPLLAEKAIAVAEHIGIVEVDHGQTSCKTPDAAAYIQKAQPITT